LHLQPFPTRRSSDLIPDAGHDESCFRSLFRRDARPRVLQFAGDEIELFLHSSHGHSLSSARTTSRITSHSSAHIRNSEILNRMRSEEHTSELQSGEN